MIDRYLQIAAGSLISVGLLLTSIHQPRATAAAQPEFQQIEVIDSYITGQVERLAITGTAIGIVRGDEIVYVRGYGAADNTGRPVTPQANA